MPCRTAAVVPASVGRAAVAEAHVAASTDVEHRPSAPWSWLADPRGIGLPMVAVLTLVVVVDVAVSLGGVGVPVGEAPDRSSVLVVDLVTLAVLFALLALARVGWLRSRVARRHPSVMLATISAAVGLAVGAGGRAGGSVAATVLGRSTAAVGGPDVTPGAVGGAVGRGLFLVAAVTVLLVLAGALAEHRDALATLRSARSTLEATLAAGERELAAERTHLDERIRTLVERGLGPWLDAPSEDANVVVGEGSGGGAGRGGGVSAALRGLADTVLRPFSHELARSVPGFGPVAPPPAAVQPWRSALASLMVEPRIRPTLLALTLTALAFRLSVAAPPVDVPGLAPVPTATGVGVAVAWGSLVASLALLTVAFAVTSVLSRWLRRGLGAFDEASVLVRWAVAVGGLALIGVTVTTFGWIVRVVTGRAFGGLAPLPPVDVGVLAANVVPLVLATLAASLVGSVGAALERQRAELGHHNEDLGIAVVRTNALLARERQDVARALHGSVQAAVNAAGIRLDRAARDGVLDDRTVAEAIASIRGALEELTGARRRTVDVAADLAAMRATWDGVAEIAIDVDPEAARRLTADHVAGPVALDVVREACANAVVHGTAARIEVAVLPEGERAVLLRVRDDGTSTHPLRTSGLGSRVLDTSCTRWNLERGPSGTELTAVLPTG